MRLLAGWFTVGAVLALATVAAVAAEKAKEVPPVLSFTMKSLEGKSVDLGDYQGKVLLVVNVASRCGYTPQYAGLQELHEKYATRGLAVLGFPCNQFGKQEPGSEEEIAAFCEKNFGVAFDMFAKVDVNGESACELYQFLTSEETDPAFAGPIKWNFEKFLIDRNGQIVARFPSGVAPNAEKLVEAIEAALGK